MAPGDLVLYLTLSPEFGGTRFGPFEGVEARLGSDKDRCHITLPESLGVAREHCRINRQGPSNLILTPSERTAAVFLWKGDARRPTQIQTATAVRPGDSFALVSAEGPRFIIELGELPAEELAKRSPSAKNSRRNRLTGKRFAEEGKRLGMARIFTLGPVQILARAWYFVSSGAIFQPRYIILGGIMAFGYLTTGLTSCAAFKYKKDYGASTADALNCREQLKIAEGAGGSAETLDIATLAVRLTGVTNLGVAFGKDTPFYQQVKAEAKKIAENPDSYDWLFEEKSSRVDEFSNWRERVEKAEELDPDTRRLVPFLAANRKRVKGDWDGILDSSDTIVCGRGPVRLTYRQAKNLGLSAVQLDAYAPGDATQLAQDEVERAKLLGRTAEAAGEPAPDVAPASGADIISQGVSACVRADGDDDRDNPSKVSTMLAAQLGRKGKFLPDADGGFGAVARLAKFFAADLKGASFVGSGPALLSFAKGSPSNAVADTPGGPWVMQRTAEVVAKALMLPCRGVLDHDRKKMETVFGKVPEAIPCLVLNYRLTHE